MPNTNHYDLIIIGTGAGGGTLASRLAPSGKKVLLLERGDFLRREKENWSTKAVVRHGRCDPGRHYFVGGLTAPGHHHERYGSGLSVAA